MVEPDCREGHLRRGVASSMPAALRRVAALDAVQLPSRAVGVRDGGTSAPLRQFVERHYTAGHCATKLVPDTVG
jgi:hypothetical protein